MWLTLTGGVLALAGTILGAKAGLKMRVDNDDPHVLQLSDHPWRSRIALALAGIGGALSIVGSLVGG